MSEKQKNPNKVKAAIAAGLSALALSGGLVAAAQHDAKRTPASSHNMDLALPAKDKTAGSLPVKLHPKSQFVRVSGSEEVPPTTPVAEPHNDQSNVTEPTTITVRTTQETPHPVVPITNPPKIILPTPVNKTTPTTAPTTTEPSTTTTTSTVPSLEVFKPETNVPATVEQVMHDNVAYIPSLGCSGFLIRNNQGLAVGVETAEHCSFLPTDTSYTEVGNQKVLNVAEPISVYTGDTLKSIVEVGQVSQVAINSEPNMSAPMHGGPSTNGATTPDTDIVIGAFSGYSLSEVTSDYKRMALSSEEIDALKPGETIYNSGWPINQPDSKAGMERQSFAMTYLGNATWPVSDGEVLGLAIAAVPESKDGAECSWGNSGSAAFIMDQSGNPRLIGTASAFNDFGLLYNKNNGEGATEKAYIEQEFGISMDGYAAVCGFAYQLPNASDTESIQIEAPDLAIDNPSTYPLEEQMLKDFFQPDYTRQIINGLVQIETPNSEPTYVDDPAYIYDPNTQSLVLGWFQQDKVGNPQLTTMSFTGDNAIADVSVIPNKGMSTPDLSTTSTGELQVDPTNDGYVDSNGLLIGQQEFDITADMFTAAQPLTVANGALALNPPMK